MKAKIYNKMRQSSTHLSAKTMTMYTVKLLKFKKMKS